MAKATTGKIDIFTHLLPPKYKQELIKKAQSGVKLDAHGSLETHFKLLPELFDLDIRFSIMDKCPEIRQVLTLPAPPVETVAGPKDALELSKIANDELAALVAKYPDRFVGAVACLPLNDIPAALKEAERAIKQLKLKGILLYTNSDGRPLDAPEFLPLYELMAEYDAPIWIHPVRGRDVADYRTESYSKYRVFHIFGWPYETSAAMSRLVFSGVLEKYPNLKFITHHCGGMVPFFAGRLHSQGQKMADRVGHFTEDTPNFSKPILDYFRMFYADTAINCNTAGLMCGYAFFGADRILFGADEPYEGVERLEGEIKAVEDMAISGRDKQKIFSGNAKKLLGIS